MVFFNQDSNAISDRLFDAIGDFAHKHNRKPSVIIISTRRKFDFVCILERASYVAYTEEDSKKIKFMGIDLFGSNDIEGDEIKLF